MRLSTLQFVITGFMLCVWAGAAPAASNEADLKKLQGNWTGVSYLMEGKPQKDFRSATMTIKGDTFTFRKKEGSDEVYQVKLDASQKPRVMDLSNGKETVPAIYAFEGDTVKICFGDKRPKEFSSTATNNQVLFVFKRKK